MRTTRSVVPRPRTRANRPDSSTSTRERNFPAESLRVTTAPRTASRVALSRMAPRTYCARATGAADTMAANSHIATLRQIRRTGSIRVATAAEWEFIA